MTYHCELDNYYDVLFTRATPRSPLKVTIVYCLKQARVAEGYFSDVYLRVVFDEEGCYMHLDEDRFEEFRELLNLLARTYVAGYSHGSKGETSV